MEEWKECKLSEIMDLIGGGTPKTSNPDYWDGDICESVSETYLRKDEKVVLINTSDVLEGKFFTHATTKNENLKGQFKKTFQKSDILYSEIRPSNRRYAFVDFEKTENYIASTKLMVIRPNQELVLPRFLYLLLTSSDLISEMQHLAETRSGTLPQITFSGELATFPIKLPPLPTQQKISAILSSLDNKIELNNKINTNLEQQIETLLLDYLSKKETTSVKLGDYLYIKGRIGWKGLKKNEYLSESKYRSINVETLTKSGIDWNKAGYISEERYTESPEIMLQIGDILLSKDGTIGKIGYVDELELPTSVASGIFVIRNNNPSVISTTFIYYLLKSKLFDSFNIARTEGSVIPHLYQKDFMDFDFPLPSPELINKIEKTTSPMFNQIINNLKENKKLNSLCNSLLPKLMNGEII